jgi:hypothetical protein
MGQSSVYGAGILHVRIEFDLAEGAFVIGHVLMQDRRQRLRLLRAQIDTLKIAHFDLILSLLLHGAENQKEVPDADADLNAISVGFAIFGSIDQIKIRLRRCDHKPPSLMGITAKRKWRE